MLNSLFRVVAAAGLVLGAVVLFLWWLLGDGNFRPWVNTAKHTVRDQIAKLVDEHSLGLEKSRAAVEEAERRMAQLRVQKHKAEAGMKLLDKEAVAAQRDVGDAQAKLVQLQERLKTGQPIRLVSGRVASTGELQNVVADLGNRIQVAKEKIGYLEQLVGRRRTRYDKLVELERQSPLAVQRLRNGVDFLARKVDLYRELQQWMNEEEAADQELSGLYEQAQRTLEDAHAKLDVKLAEFDALLDASMKIEIAPDGELDGTDKLLGDIRTLLGVNQVALEP